MTLISHFICHNEKKKLWKSCPLEGKHTHTHTFTELSRGRRITTHKLERWFRNLTTTTLVEMSFDTISTHPPLYWSSDPGEEHTVTSKNEGLLHCFREDMHIHHGLKQDSKRSFRLGTLNDVVLCGWEIPSELLDSLSWLSTAQRRVCWWDEKVHHVIVRYFSSLFGSWICISCIFHDGAHYTTSTVCLLDRFRLFLFLVGLCFYGAFFFQKNEIRFFEDLFLFW